MKLNQTQNGFTGDRPIFARVSPPELFAGWSALLAAVALACGPSPGTEVDATTGPGPDATSTGTTGPGPDASSTIDPPTTGGPDSDPTSPGTPGPGTDAGTSTDNGTSTGDMLECNFVFECEVPAPECDVWAQDCGPGEKCSAYGQFASENIRWSTICTPIAQDPAGLGEPCVAEEPNFQYSDDPYAGVHSGIDNCGAGLKCWGLDSSHQGTCRPLCTGSADAPVCPEQMECFAFDQSEDQSHLIDLCLDLCDPVLPGCTGVNELCIPVEEFFVCRRDDAPTINLPAYGKCYDEHDCLSGFICGESGSCEADQGECCLPYCDIGVDPNPACNPDLGETCVKLYANNPPPGAEHVGRCFSPG